MRLVVTALLVVPMLAPTYAESRTQPVRCDTIQPGETVFAVARRVTGRPENLREAWFRIVDGRRVIPKAGYNRVKAGWQACIPAEHRLSRVLVSGGAPSTAGSRTVSAEARDESVLDPHPAASRPAADWPLTLALMCL